MCPKHRPRNSWETEQPNKKPVVLVIDDSDIDREVMVDLLQQAGIDAHGLPSPIGVTRKAREKLAQVIIVDQNLPAMDGSKLTALFRSNPALRGIRVIMVSGNDESQMLAVAREAQADAFICKERLQDDLVQTVRRLLPSSVFKRVR